MQGKRTLTPLGWHLSGMPIKACADKLTNEIKMFGRDFEKYAEEGLDEVTPGDKVSAKDDPTKFSSAKSKVRALAFSGPPLLVSLKITALHAPDKSEDWNGPLSVPDNAECWHSHTRNPSLCRSSLLDRVFPSDCHPGFDRNWCKN